MAIWSLLICLLLDQILLIDQSYHSEMLLIKDLKLTKSNHEQVIKFLSNGQNSVDGLQRITYYSTQ